MDDNRQVTKRIDETPENYNEEDEIPTEDMDAMMAYNGVSWHDFI